MTPVTAPLRPSFAAIDTRRAALAAASLAVLTGLLVLLTPAAAAVLAAVVIAAIGLASLIRVLVPTEDRAAFFWIVAAGLGLRAATAAAVTLFSPTGFLTGDDIAYATAASLLVDHWRGESAPGYGPPVWGGYAYLMGTYVHVEAAFFYAFGKHVLGMQILNAALMLAAGLLASWLARRLLGRTPALLTLAGVTFFPSLVVWSSLNLKDALSLAIVVLVFALIAAFQARHRWWLLAACVALIVPLEGLRRYVFLLLALIVPLSVAFAPGPRPLLRRLAWTAAAGLAIAAVVIGIGTRVPSDAAQLETIRQAMAKTARTGYVEAPAAVIIAKPGDTFIVRAASAAPTASVAPSGGATSSATAKPTSAPTSAPTTIVVPPETRVALAPQAWSVPTVVPGTSGRPGTVYVRPGDMIVVGPSADPARERRPLVLSPSEQDAETAVALSARDALARTIAYLPKGTLYALFAPFPWEAETLGDLLTVPDMLLWYAVLTAAAISVWKLRAKWRWLLPLAAFVAGVIGVFVLAEGNTGTLFRHRATILPFMVMLASPAVAGLLERWERWPRVLVARRADSAYREAER